MKSTLTLFSVLLSPLLFAQTFTSNPNQIIPDDNTETVFNLNVSGLPSAIGATFGLEEVCLSLNHTWDEDLRVKLQSPDGSTVTLFEGVGGNGDNFTNTCMRGDATNPIGSGSAPFSGTFKPAETLGNINNNQNPNGTWKLLVTDMSGQDIGTLLSWKITFGNNPALPFIFLSSNLPIVKINTFGQQIPQDPKLLAHMQMIYNGEGVRNYTNQTDYYYEGDMLIEIQGFTGSSYPKTNYDFELIDANGEARDTNLLGMNPESDWMFKSEWTDGSLMRNSLTYEMARRMGMYAPDTRFCEIILNGVYIGMYTITEKIKRSSDRVDIAKLLPTDISGPELTGGYIIEMNINGDAAAWTSAYAPSNAATSPFPVEFKHVYPKAINIQTQQHDYIKTFTDSFENALNGPQFQDAQNGFRRFADEQSFIDFCIVNEFSANYDSYGRSTYLYKEKVTDGNKLHIGPVWDYDRAYSSGPADGWVWEETHPYWPFPFWWTKLQDDTLYMKKFYCRWHSLRANVLSVDSFYTYIDSTKALLAESFDRNLTRWPELGSGSIDGQVDYLKSFIGGRLIWMDEHITDPTLEIPVFSMNDTIICEGEQISIDVGPQYNFTWSTGSSSSSSSFPQSGDYWVRASDIYGCQYTQYFHVDVSVPNAVFTSQQMSGLNYQFTPVQTQATSWSWNFGDASTSSLQSPNHVYATGGNYTVSLTITDMNGCTDTYSQLININNVGVAEIMADDLKIYPNPFNASFTISAKNNINSIYIYNSTGQLIYFENNAAPQKTIGLDEISSGIYFIKIETENGVAIRKIVKE